MTLQLPAGMVWKHRPFPDANFLLLQGEQVALIDSGFAAHADETKELVGEHAPSLDLVVNTHWHSDHVGANRLFQAAGAGIVGSEADAELLDRRSPDCCMAEYLDQPVPQYTVDTRVTDGDRLLLGDSEWHVLAVPGHTPGHLAFWNSDQRILAAGDTLSTYDVGWINIMRDGLEALDDAPSSLHRLRELDPSLILPGHGPIVAAPAEALGKAIEHIQRQRADRALAVSCGAKRILAFALMIRDGIRRTDLDDYLAQRAWVRDAAALLGQTIDEFARTLIDSMLTSGAVSIRNGTVRAAASSTTVDPSVFGLPFPRDWNAPDAVADG